MKNTVLFFLIAISGYLFAQEKLANAKGPYFGQKPAGSKVELFAPEIIAYEVHESPSISSDLTEILIASMEEGIKYYKMTGDLWQLVKKTPFKIPKSCNGLFISPSGNRLYYLVWENNDENFYFSEKIEDKWTEIKPLGDEVNSFKTHWQFSLSRNENLYFSSGNNILVSVFDGKKHLKPVNLKFENGENVEGGTPFIAPDENYLIYSRIQNPAVKTYALFISYKLKDNIWTSPIDLGPDINKKETCPLCPKVSPDGKYFFFINRISGPDFKIYWADAGFIEMLKPASLK